MSLFYLADSQRFDLLRTVTEFNGDKYYLVRQIPLAEMLSHEPQDIAEELIGITTSGDWRRMRRRPIICGDIFCVGLEPWVYAKEKAMADLDMVIPSPQIQAAFGLKAWPKYVILNLAVNSARVLLCK
jgi:hypothetical protein